MAASLLTFLASIVLSTPSSLGQTRVLPLGDSITAGSQGGPYSPPHSRGGYRYFLERFLEGSEGGASGFIFTGSVTAAPGTIASYAGKWYPEANSKPLNHPAHSGYSGYTIALIDGLVADDTIPVASSDVVLLQIGTNDIGVMNVPPQPATQVEMSGWLADYQALLDRILSKSTSVKIVMAKIPPITSGSVIGNIATNQARIEPFNAQVVQVLYETYSVDHPGRFFLVDNYLPLDPLNVEDSYATATNQTDFLTVIGDGVHPYNAGHRKIAINFWKAFQLSQGAADVDLVTVHDGGADACIRQIGSAPDGHGESSQPWIRSSTDPSLRAKYYVKLDLSGKPKYWEEVQFNLVFWGAPASAPNFGNCCDDASAPVTLQLYGIPDGQDQWDEGSITWTNAPGNQTDGNSVTGIYLGDLVIPSGSQTGDVISVSTTALRDFVNYQRGVDGLITLVVTGGDVDPGYFPTFSDSQFRDYSSSFLQMKRGSSLPSQQDFRIVSFDVDTASAPLIQGQVTFLSEPVCRYLLSTSKDLKTFDEVLIPDIEGAIGSTSVNFSTTVPPNSEGRFFLRVEKK